MARAKRHFLPGHVWHITHRCHKKEFLLKFARDRRRWLQWLFEAKKESKRCVLGMGFWRVYGVEEILKTKNYVRESKWSQSIAVGSKSFVEGIKKKLGIRAKGRKEQ